MWVHFWQKIPGKCFTFLAYKIGINERPRPLDTHDNHLVNINVFISILKGTHVFLKIKLFCFYS
jgi:hypothetical protein